VQQLVYFLASVHHGSFAAAAQSLYIAQPSLSEQVRLEALLELILRNKPLPLTRRLGTLEPCLGENRHAL
jgi:DNA-binding transcriptional LysR family regulator